MNAVDLPQALFIRGTAAENGQFSFVMHDDADGYRFLCVWSTEALIRQWLSAFGVLAEYSHIDRDALLQHACLHSSWDYLLYNPPTRWDHRVKPFSVEPDTELAPVKNARHMLKFMSRSAGEGAAEWMQLILKRQHDLKPMELLQLTREIMSRPSAELKLRETFDIACDLLRDKLLELGRPDHVIAHSVDVFSGNPKFRLVEALEYATLAATPIKVIKDRGTFEQAWKVAEGSMRVRGDVNDEVELLRRQAEANDDLTLADIYTKVPRHTIPEDIRFVVETCSLPAECSRCAETSWTIISVSPNRRSAIVACEYCGKREILVVGAARTSRRQPIPKDVQREVWRRDQGRCVECGSKENLHFDHIIPDALGGGSTARNIQLLCEKCNLRKSDSPPGSY